MNEFVRVSCKKIEDEFVEKVLPIKDLPHGIIPSEGFAFCALSKSLDVEIVLESGVCEGLSTTIWSRFFQSIPIIAVDIKLQESVVQKFSLIFNVQLLKGKGEKLLPTLIQKNSDKRIAIFIDGPKGMLAIDLAKKCLKFKNVVLVGIHDLHKISFDKANERREFLDNSGIIDFYTDDLEFVEKYAFMDEPKNCIGIKEGETHWEPGWVISKIPGKTRNLGSYGRTIGFIIKAGNSEDK